MPYGTARIRAVPESGVGLPAVLSPEIPNRAARAAAGPLDLHLPELEWFGLGIIVRDLRVRGAALQEPLRRLYCLSCGRAVAHEPSIPEWWICGRGCNERSGAAPSGEVTSETA
jgi:hypothetical protein